MSKEEFIEELRKLNIVLTPSQLDALDTYYKLLIKWNEVINLTTITEEKDVYLKHFYDSLTIYKDIDLTKNIKLCDVGTGAGFPGIVLKIVFPNLEITLIDSLNKRINFLKNVIQTLNLTNITAIHTRMEHYSKENSLKYDIITSRATSSTMIISEISINALKIGGKLVLMKGIINEDIKETNKSLAKLGAKIVHIDKFILPKEESNRSILIIEKKESTNSKYPRSIDKIKKNPL